MMYFYDEFVSKFIGPSTTNWWEHSTGTYYLSLLSPSFSGNFASASGDGWTTNVEPYLVNTPVAITGKGKILYSSYTYFDSDLVLFPPGSGVAVGAFIVYFDDGANKFGVLSGILTDVIDDSESVLIKPKGYSDSWCYI